MKKTPRSLARPRLTTLALALGSTLLLQPTAQAETLREAVSIALGQHPQVLGARRNAEAIRHEVTGALKQSRITKEQTTSTKDSLK